MAEPPDMRVAFVLVLASWLGLVSPAGVGASSGYARQSERLVRWTQTFGGGGDVDRGPTVDVYVDRTVVATFPRYMRRAGVHSMRLDTGEWRALMETVGAAGVADFDPDRARTECAVSARSARAAGATPDFVGIHDAATTHLEVRPSAALAIRSRRATGLAGRGAAEASWYALAATAARHPDVSSLQGLAGLERAMKNLLADPRMRRRTGRAE